MTEWREPFCPMCGRTMGKRNIYLEPGKPWTKTGEENRWEATKDFTGDKPFGVVKGSEGRGSMKLVRYYGVEEDVEGYYPLMRKRLLNVIREYLEKGWLQTKEVEDIIKNSKH